MKIELLKTHVHQGRERVAGEEIELRKDQAELLIEIGRAKAIPKSVKSKK